MTERSLPSTAAAAGSDGPAGTDDPVSSHPVSRPPHPLAVTSVAAGILGVLSLPFVGSFEAHGWWVVLPTLASLVAVLSGHLAVRRIAKADRTDRRLATGGLFAGYLGLTILVAETVLLVGVLSLAATVVGNAGG